MAMVAESSINNFLAEFNLQVVGGCANGAPRTIHPILVGLREGETTATGTTTAGMHERLAPWRHRRLGRVLRHDGYSFRFVVLKQWIGSTLADERSILVSTPLAIWTVEQHWL